MLKQNLNVLFFCKTQTRGAGGCGQQGGADPEDEEEPEAADDRARGARH